MIDFINPTNNFTHIKTLIFISMCFSQFLCKATMFLFMKSLFFFSTLQWRVYPDENIIFFFTFLNKTMCKDKTHIMTSSSRSLPKPNTNKKGEEKWTWLLFSEKEKNVYVVCRKQQENWKRCFASLRPLYNGLITSRNQLCQNMIK